MPVYQVVHVNCCWQLLGCAILGIGIWLQVSKAAYASLAPSYNVLSATILLISAGVLVLIIGFFGCCGAIMESKCMLVTVRKVTLQMHASDDTNKTYY